MMETAELGHELDKPRYDARVPALRTELLSEQRQLELLPYSVHVVVAGDDRAGCNELLNRLHQWLDARLIDMTAFGAPTDEERARPFFWRYWRTLPARGRIGLFYDAWNMSTLRNRLSDKWSEAEFERAIQRVRGFERMRVADGGLVLKFWLHRPAGPSASEQGRAGRAEHSKKAKKNKKAAKKSPKRGRPDRRLDDEADATNGASEADAAATLGEWDAQLSADYVENRELVEELVRRTSTGEAPWHIIESTDSRYRDVAVGERLLAALTRHRGHATAPRPAEPAPVRLATDPLSVLDAVDLTSALPHAEYKERLGDAQRRIGQLAREAYHAKMASVLVFQGWDASGKGGAIRRLTRPLDARLYRVVAVGKPTDEEMAHHYLWRFWRHLPAAGRLTVFDRSWYGRVLVERVEGFAREDEWRRAYTEINDFEEQLHHHGVVLRKFWLHISPDEQLRRFQEREETPHKRHKIGPEDYRNRSRWHDYELAADEMMARTSTRHAPWVVVPANDKKWARVGVLEEVVHAFEHALEQRA